MNEIDAIKETIRLAGLKSIGKNNSTWTENLNKEFTNFGHNKDLHVYSKTEGSDWHEWLYDVTICKQDGEEILESYLVLESEWKTDDVSINEDFQKLLLSNSKFKVMVFDSRKDIIPNMLGQIKKYKNANGIFILACHISNGYYEFEEYNCSSKQ